APDGYDSCKSRVAVKIVRKGRVIERVKTRPSGRFRAELPHEGGRFRAVVPQVQVDDTNICARARSRARRI
ncbi:MAG: hypothetical protein M3279_07435, partial [Actinomycetota bacterium]|nr:hypothetical protein [Actinomycetota bacterium]